MVASLVLRPAGLLLAGSIVVGCRPDAVPKVAFKAAEVTVRATPDLASEALKTAGSARRAAQAARDPRLAPSGPPTYVAGAPPTDPSGAPGYYPAAAPVYPAAPAANACAYQGAAPDGRAVYVCGGYPWIQDPRTGAWVLYTVEQAGPPQPR